MQDLVPLGSGERGRVGLDGGDKIEARPLDEVVVVVERRRVTVVAAMESIEYRVLKSLKSCILGVAGLTRLFVSETQNNFHHHGALDRGRCAAVRT